MAEPKKIILFASGSGSNAENVCKYFLNSKDVKIVALFCNKQHAGVLPKMATYQVPTVVFTKEQLNNPEYFLALIKKYNPDLIALLGFLLKVPAYLVQTYPQQIVNLHPALLPKYGGKGMYGTFVHQAVKDANDTETGITLHWVNEHYDEGAIIAQFKTSIDPTDSVSDIANKIAILEMKHVPTVIENILLNK